MQDYEEGINNLGPKRITKDFIERSGPKGSVGVTRRPKGHTGRGSVGKWPLYPGNSTREGEHRRTISTRPGDSRWGGWRHREYEPQYKKRYKDNEKRQAIESGFADYEDEQTRGFNGTMLNIGSDNVFLGTRAVKRWPVEEDDNPHVDPSQYKKEKYFGRDRR